jgi:hypothetical protein
LLGNKEEFVERSGRARQAHRLAVRALIGALIVVAGLGGSIIGVAAGETSIIGVAAGETLTNRGQSVRLM